MFETHSHSKRLARRVEAEIVKDRSEIQSFLSSIIGNHDYRKYFRSCPFIDPHQ